MNDPISYLQGLDAQTQLILSALACLAILLIGAIVYTITRKRTPDGPIKYEREIESLNERNKQLRKRLSRQAATEQQKPTEEQTTLEQAKKTIDLQRLQLDTVRTDLSNWKQRSVRAEEIIEQKVNELSAVYKADRDYNQGVTTLFLSHISNIKDINTAFTSQKMPSFTMPQIGSGAIIVCLIIYAYLNKPLTQKIITLLGTPRFQLYLVIGLIVLGVIIYYWKYRKDSK